MAIDRRVLFSGDSFVAGGRGLSAEPDHCEIAREIDEEIRRVVEAAHRRASTRRAA